MPFYYCPLIKECNWQVDVIHITMVCKQGLKHFVNNNGFLKERNN